MRISIIVCTYNRCEILKYCLDSLEKQYVEKAQYEVIVVDNNSTDNTKEVVEEYCRKNSNFKYVFESNQGLSHARNRGAKEAKADWVGYVDDDGKVRENYIEQALFTIENFDFDCFGGKVVNWFKYGRPRWYNEIYDAEKEKYAEVCEYDGFISGGISFYKKDIIVINGGFPGHLGMNGRKLGYGEETYLQILIKDNGKIGFNPKIILEHLVPEHKMSVLWQLKRRFFDGEADGLISSDDYMGFSERIKCIFKVSINTAKVLYLNFKRFFLNKDYYYQNFMFDSFSEFLFTIGRLKSKKFKRNGDHV